MLSVALCEVGRLLLSPRLRDGELGLEPLDVGLQGRVVPAQGVNERNIGRLSGRRMNTVRPFGDMYAGLSVVSACIRGQRPRIAFCRMACGETPSLLAAVCR